MKAAKLELTLHYQSLFLKVLINQIKWKLIINLCEIALAIYEKLVEN